jgi:hypothetical protein
MPLPSMYQYHQHTITRYVSQPCTKVCTKPSTCTIPSINYVPKHVPQQVHQPCTNTCNMYCTTINHQPYINTSTMYQYLYQHVSTCTSKCVSTPVPCTSYHPPCTNKYNHVLNTWTIPYTIPCISTIYYIIHHHTPCTTRYTKQVISMVYLNHVPISPRYAPHTCTTITMTYTKPDIKIAKSVLLKIVSCHHQGVPYHHPLCLKHNHIITKHKNIHISINVTFR